MSNIDEYLRRLEAANAMLALKNSTNLKDKYTLSPHEQPGRVWRTYIDDKGKGGRKMRQYRRKSSRKMRQHRRKSLRTRRGRSH
jgi:hypothetical protein